MTEFYTSAVAYGIRVSESGNYKFAIRNNSGVTVKVSGFLKY